MPLALEAGEHEIEARLAGSPSARVSFRVE
jgi:hypothetical protein